ncbi:Uncharacterised protein [BD1-7 clade bacterium]|uniref:Phospholipase C n=1 Tax=BD1-7 clade bacterium TaxID=2029982 RepID=A0A5S9Q412_9GAMM|nr:Uncharacterised protein [BD1-7 clade bacterium]
MNLTIKLTLALACFSASTCFAFTQPTHKRIVLDAIDYVKAHPDKHKYQVIEAAARAAGYNLEAFAEAMGQGAYDVDDFADTYLCGAMTGDCVMTPAYGVITAIPTYTAYWHFQNQTRGSDIHGNDFGGYNYSELTVNGTIDDMAAAWLYGDHLDDGEGGMTGVCLFGHCLENSRYNSYDITEANYRIGSQSDKSMYAQFQSAAFQPIDNLVQYWYSQFLLQPSAQTLGFVMHATDLLQPHHTWTTSDHNHSGWESWIEDYYDIKELNDDQLITEALENFVPLPADATDIRPLITQGGNISYSMGGSVLHSKADADRTEVARIVIPHAIAMVVLLLDHAAGRFEQQSIADVDH